MTETTTTMKPSIACIKCGKKQNTQLTPKAELRLPPRWKRDAAKAPVCPNCWRAAFVLRALTFPVASPIGLTWEQLREKLKPMWRQSTQAANWMMTECYARDVRPIRITVSPSKAESAESTDQNGNAAPATEERLPVMPRVYLYPEARKRFPDLPPQTVVSIEQAVQRKYRAMRLKVLWQYSASLPSMRYPQPYPINVQSWEFRIERSFPFVKFRLGDDWAEVRLKGGPQFGRQISGLRNMAERGELAVIKAHDGTIMMKLVGWIHRREARDKQNGVLYVRTAADAFLIALDVEQNRIWVENCDHLKRWIAEHARRIHRLAEDQKAEQRPVPSFEQRREDYVRKQRNRMASAIKEIAMHVCRFAKRRRFQVVEYDDSERGYLGESGGPYFQFAERIKIVLDEMGIEFRVAEKSASGKAATKTPAPLAEMKTE